MHRVWRFGSASNWKELALNPTLDELKAWIGRSETLHDSAQPVPVAALAAMLDHAPVALDAGLPLPPPAPAETATRVKPVVSAGLKAYISPRAFFRADILAMVRAASGAG